MNIAIIVLLVAILAVLIIRRPTLVKTCPSGYYYAPWASSGTECIPIGASSSEAGISSDSKIPEMYSSKMSPAWEANAVFYKNLMDPTY